MEKVSMKTGGRTDEERARLYKLSKWHRKMRMSETMRRNLAIAEPEIERMTSELSIPADVKERCLEIYKMAVERGLIKGRSIEGVVAASIYMACRECGMPRTLDEIAAASLSKKQVKNKRAMLETKVEVGKIYRFLRKELEIKLPVVSPMEYINRFCKRLKLKDETREKAMEIVSEASERELISGKGPIGIAAAAIYIASILCNDKRTQKDVANATGVTEVTIRNRYKELVSKLRIKF